MRHLKWGDGRERMKHMWSCIPCLLDFHHQGALRVSHSVSLVVEVADLFCVETQSCFSPRGSFVWKFPSWTKQQC